MGLEASCDVEWAGESGHGRAKLESDALRFNGPFRMSIPLGDIQKVVARDGMLEITAGRERAVFHLGAVAERWADKILNPPSVLYKLGVKPGMAVGVVGLADESLLEQLRARTERVSVGRPRKDSDIIFLFAVSVTDLARLAGLRERIVAGGAVWTIWPKGRAELKEDHVRDAARAAGLVDVKVASVSDRLSALKLMIPRAQRA
jgi:hypothetical protein